MKTDTQALDLVTETKTTVGAIGHNEILQGTSESKRS